HWQDADDNFWVFGGTRGWGYSNEVNELWKWSPTAQQWSWERGGPAHVKATYGTAGVASATNVPGGRSYAGVWASGTDALYVFGGYGYDENAHLGYLSDLWKFDGEDWTWLAG